MAIQAVLNVPLRSWCFTVFNPSGEVEEKLLGLKEVADRLVVGREKCPTTGTPHLQGYIRFKKSCRFAAIKKLLPDGSHIEPRNGHESQATAYCLKDGDVLVDQGVDVDRGRGNSKRTRDEEVGEVIEEIEKGEKYGAIRNRHKKFFFFYRRHVVDYMRDEQRLAGSADYLPTSFEDR